MRISLSVTTVIAIEESLSKIEDKRLKQAKETASRKHRQNTFQLSLPEHNKKLV